MISGLVLNLCDQVTIDPVASWPNAAGHVVAQRMFDCHKQYTAIDTSATVYINSLLITLNARKILRVTDGCTADCSEKVAVPLSHGLHDRCSKLPSDSASQMEAGSAKAMSLTGIGTHASVIDISLETGR